MVKLLPVVKVKGSEKYYFGLITKKGRVKNPPLFLPTTNGK
jgi:hypothetical protein